MWTYLQTQWPNVYQRFTGAFLISRIVGSVTDSFASEAMAQDISAFFAGRPAEVSVVVCPRRAGHYAHRRLDGARGDRGGRTFARAGGPSGGSQPQAVPGTHPRQCTVAAARQRGRGSVVARAGARCLCDVVGALRPFAHVRAGLFRPPVPIVPAAATCPSTNMHTWNRFCKHACMHSQRSTKGARRLSHHRTKERRGVRAMGYTVNVHDTRPRLVCLRCTAQQRRPGQAVDDAAQRGRDHRACAAAADAHGRVGRERRRRGRGQDRWGPFDCQRPPQRVGLVDHVGQARQVRLQHRPRADGVDLA